jgi:hypothetical protein
VKDGQQKLTITITIKSGMADSSFDDGRTYMKVTDVPEILSTISSGSMRVLRFEALMPI